jgi:L-ascorbate metabolism protein UlaG (beta-lactamase superfamily)
MKVLLILLVVLSSVCCHPSSREDGSLEITYIANEGFLIESEAGKILIDALFHDPRINFCDVPPQEVLEKMENAEAPFHDVDLVLVTHDHWDHFSVRSVTRHMKANPKSMLICTSPAAEKIRNECSFHDELSGRVKEVASALYESVDLDINGIPVRAHRMRHGQYMEKDEKTGEMRDRHAEVQNLVYLIEMGGTRFLHMGDATLKINREFVQSLVLEKQHIRVAFVEYFDTDQESKEILENHVRPDHIIFMHLPANRNKKKQLADHLRTRFPNGYVFKESMEKVRLN